MVLLAALFVAALALRPQLVGAGPLLPEIQADLGVSHAVEYGPERADQLGQSLRAAGRGAHQERARRKARRMAAQAPRRRRDA